jgi:hypothetical protein
VLLKVAEGPSPVNDGPRTKNLRWTAPPRSGTMTLLPSGFRAFPRLLPCRDELDCTRTGDNFLPSDRTAS